MSRRVGWVLVWVAVILACWAALGAIAWLALTPLRILAPVVTP